jgi:hypothetical protein
MNEGLLAKGGRVSGCDQGETSNAADGIHSW